jgi:putative peptidoglycan lipid II flippase
MAYALGVMGFMCVKILASAYYAKQDIKTPVRIAMLTVVTNAVLSGLLIKPLAHTGLALATSLAALLNAGLLGIILWRRNIYVVQPGWKLFAFRLGLALFAMAGLVLYFNPAMEDWFVMSHMERVLNLAILLGVGISSYVGTLLATGLRLHHLLVKVEAHESGL